MPVNVTPAVVQKQQIGQEASLGAGGNANRYLRSMILTPTDEHVVRAYRPQGRRFKALNEPQQDWLSFSLAGDAEYSEILYAIENIFGTVAPVLTNTKTYTRTYDVALTGAITPKSWVYQYGDANNANQAVFGIVSSLGAKYNRKSGVQVAGKGFMQAPTTGATFTSSPTQPEIQPIEGPHLNWYWDTTGAGIGGTQVVDQIVDGQWDYNDAFVPFWPMNRTNASFSGQLDKEPTPTVRLTFGESAWSRTQLAGLKSGTTYFLRINAQGPLIEASNYFTLNVDVAVQLDKIGERKAMDEVYAYDVTLNVVEDSTWGHAMMLTSVTDISAL